MVPMTIRYTKKYIILAFLAALLIPPAFADFPGFKNSGVTTLRDLIQVNTVIKNGIEAMEAKND